MGRVRPLAVFDYNRRALMQSLLIRTMSGAVAGGVSYAISYAIVCFLLGFHWFGTEGDPFRDVRALRPDVRQVVAFDVGGHLLPGDITNFAAAAGLGLDALPDRKRTRDRIVPIDRVIGLNRHPAMVRNENYPYWISLGYRSADNRYHQITWYGGEADGTPSVLVRTRPPGHGDFYVRYTIEMSEPTADQAGTSAVPLRVEGARWHAYRQLSYDGFEEVGFTVLGMVLLTSVVAASLAPGRVSRSNHGS